MLGAGAFATVYRAHDPHLDTDVAVKVLGEPAAHDPDLRRRFIDEARVLRQLDDDRVVAVRDLGEAQGRPFLVLDLHESGTLADRLAAVGAGSSIEPAELAHVVRELAAMMRAIHESGLIHRDLKPSNLLLAGERGDAVVLGAAERVVAADFGLARRSDATALTVGGGTGAYMAPEQRSPEAQVDARADLFAATRIVDEIVVRSGDTDLAATIARPLARGLADRPADRPADATSWSSMLVGALAGQRSGRRADPVGARSRTPVVLAVGLLLVGLIAVVALLAGSDRGTRYPDGPQIIGPDELLIGEPGSWTHENRAGVTYEWMMPDGERLEALVVEFTPTEPDEFRIRLTETDQGVVRRSEQVVQVRTR